MTRAGGRSGLLTPQITPLSLSLCPASPHPPQTHAPQTPAQLRGSIPLIWTQIPNIKYKPPTKLLQGEATAAAFDAHMDGLLAKYKVGTYLIVCHAC